MTCKHCGLEIEWSSKYNDYKRLNTTSGVGIVCYGDLSNFDHEPNTHEQVNKLLNEYYG